FINVVPGQEIILTAGVTFSGTNHINIPPKNNPNNRWIVVRTSALANLPADGNRIDPAVHAQYMPRIRTTSNNWQVFIAQAGAGTACVDDVLFCGCDARCSLIFLFCFGSSE